MLQPKKNLIKKEVSITEKDNASYAKPLFRSLKKLNVRNKTDKEIVDEREVKINKSVDAQKEDIIGNKNWRDVLARESSALPEKLRFSLKPNVVDDSSFNPIQMIGSMAANLGSAPDRAKKEDSVLPYVTSVGAPLVTGALAGIGVKNTKEFVNNLVNPFAGFDDVYQKLKLQNKLPLPYLKRDNLIKSNLRDTILSKDLEPYISNSNKTNIEKYTPFKDDKYLKEFNEKRNKNIVVIPDKRSILKNSSIIDINDKDILAYGGIINTNTNDMKYVKRPVKKLGIGGLLSAGSSLVGTVNPIAGIGMGAAGSIISGLEGQDAAQEAKNAMLVQMLKDKKLSDVQNNINYKVNGNNDYSYYAEGGEIPNQEKPKPTRAELEASAKIKREEIVRKKDSIIQRNLNATGLDRMQYRAKQKALVKQPDVQLDGMQTTDANKRTDKKGSCSTGATMGGDSLKDVKAYGGSLQSSTTGKFDTTGGKLIPLSNDAEIAVGNTHNSKQIDGEYGITLDKGGEPIAEVENKEVITNGQRVFSDRLMFDKNNTFADKMGKIATMSGKIEAKLSKTKDTKSINGYKRMLAGNKMQEDALFQQQEEAQEVEGSDKMAYGGSIPKYANGNNDFLKSLLELNQDSFSRSSNKGQVEPTKIDTTSYLNEAVKAPINVTEGKDITSKDPNAPKTFMDYLKPSLIDNGVNALLTATTPKLASPIKNVAQRLKTTYNANPELAAVSRETNAVAQNVLQNTADSNDARANIASARLQGMIAKGNILGRKENIETQLINQDKGNKQNVDASNTALANKYMGDKFNRANDIQTRISGNFANLSEDIKGSQTAVGMDKYYRQQLILDLQNDITGSKARAYKNNAKLMADPEIAAMVNATFQSRKLN